MSAGYAATHASRVADQQRHAQADRRLELLEEQVQDMGSLLRTFQKYHEACEEAHSGEDLLRRVTQLERLVEANAGWGHGAARPGADDSSGKRFEQLQQQLVETHQENHYVHQHNAQVLRQLGSRLQQLEQRVECQQQSFTSHASIGLPSADVQELQQQLATTQAKLRQHEEQLSRCQEASQHSQRVAVATSTRLQHMQDHLKHSLAEVRSLVTYNLQTPPQPLSTAQPQPQTQLPSELQPATQAQSAGASCANRPVNSHDQDMVRDQLQAVTGRLDEINRQYSGIQDSYTQLDSRCAAMLSRLEQLESRRCVSVQDAQRLFQYTGIITGIHGGLHTAVSQLRESWPRVVQSLQQVRTELEAELTSGNPATATATATEEEQLLSLLAGSGHQEAAFPHRMRRPAVSTSRVPRALVEVAAAQEAVAHAQAVVEVLSQQMAKSELVTHVAREKFGGKLPIRCATDAQLAKSQEVSDQASGLHSSDTAQASPDLQKALRHLSSVTQQLADRLHGAHIPDTANRVPDQGMQPDQPHTAQDPAGSDASPIISPRQQREPRMPTAPHTVGSDEQVRAPSSPERQRPRKPRTPANPKLRHMLQQLTHCHKAP